MEVGSILENIDFNPPAPCGAGPIQKLHKAAHAAFQSTRPVRGGTYSDGVRTCIKKISIHPPRAGRDVRGEVNGLLIDGISIHPPRAGRDFSANRH